MPKTTTKLDKKKDVEEDIGAVKLSATSEKYINELSKSDCHLKKKCSEIDKHIELLDKEIDDTLKNKSDNEDQFVKCRDYYMQIAACVTHFDALSSKLIFAFESFFNLESLK